MRRRIDKTRIKAWTESVGGHGKAATILIQKTKVSPTLAEKLASGAYPSQPNALLRRAICTVTGYDEDELFPLEGIHAS